MGTTGSEPDLAAFEPAPEPALEPALAAHAPITVRVRYFAALREALGASETVTLAGPATLGGLRDQLLQRSAEHARLLARGRAVRAALNQVMADESVALVDGAEVAFFPPVTGG